MRELTDNQIQASIAYLDPDLESDEGVGEGSSVAHGDAPALGLIFLILSSGSLAFILLYQHVT